MLDLAPLVDLRVSLAGPGAGPAEGVKRIPRKWSPSQSPEGRGCGRWYGPTVGACLSLPRVQKPYQALV